MTATLNAWEQAKAVAHCRCCASDAWRCMKAGTAINSEGISCRCVCHKYLSQAAPAPESPRPTKESIRELVEAFGVARHTAGFQGGDVDTTSAVWEESVGVASKAEDALLSAIDGLIDERDSAIDSREEWRRTADAFAQDVVDYLNEIQALKQSHLDTPPSPKIPVSRVELIALRQEIEETTGGDIAQRSALEMIDGWLRGHP